MESSDDKDTTKELMEREYKNLLSEIDRLERKCLMFISRIGIRDRQYRGWSSDTEINRGNPSRLCGDEAGALVATCVLRDLQISYLTMVFLPASFTASIFGMNVAEMNPAPPETIARYVEASFVLTFATTWVVIALQSYSTIHKSGAGVWRRAAWPTFYLSRKFMEYFRLTSSQDNNPCLRPIRREGRPSTLMFDDAA